MLLRHSPSEKKTRKTRNTRIRQRHLAVVSAKQQRTFMLDRRSTPASANGSGALHIFLLHNGRLQTRLLRAGNNDPAGTPLMRFRRCESHQAEEVGDAATRSATSRFGGKMPGIIPSSNTGRKKKMGTRLLSRNRFGKRIFDPVLNTGCPRSLRFLLLQRWVRRMALCFWGAFLFVVVLPPALPLCVRLLCSNWCF